MIRLSIIVLTYNTRDLTLACLSSLVAQYRDQLEKAVFEIILVDNASSDKTVSEVTDTFYQIPNIRIIENPENVGFSKGNNIGAHHAKGTYLLFLNSDTNVHDNQFTAMVQYLDTHESIGVFGGKLKDRAGHIEHTARTFYNLTDVVFMLFGGERLISRRRNQDSIVQVDWVSGGCMMTSRALFEKLGGFDEHLFMYTEDMEYCYRVKQAGHTVYYYPDIAITHMGQGSANRTFAIVHIYQGLLYFYKKHKSPIEYRLVKFLLLLKAYLAIAMGYITNNNYLKKTYSQSLQITI